MASAKSKFFKVLGFLFLISAWTGGVLWADWQSPKWVEEFLAEEPVVPVAKFYPLDKFIISIPGDKYPHYLLLELALKSNNPKLKSVLDEADPLIRNSLMKMFSRKSFEQLNSTEQLDSLQNEALMHIVKVLVEHKFPSDIDEVLFTRMVIQ
ncbi:flagellar basal body-associated protein FliL [Shewanella denitrificans OS217]|jgi:flagellar protein FliL|uniref:Flagellar protein FliL n=1 Tax=Shewanella denitrificans (strain OS217 / ATCC BAA-1090 / DSM 15013) TaxID=318161 RepID=Q12I17_SHEDO|nr:flagellar basal body-associated FliL family protein [Shewanella denitrificans]ABE56909.1 flagellar basal body-associated protein FliL [Shewanella denitrificans OS217]